jgi:hypothetical protein
MTLNRYQFVTNNESSKNTNKSEINKLRTNNRCQILENIVPINETSEQNPIRYCKKIFIYVGIQQMLPLCVASWYFLIS